MVLKKQWYEILSPKMFGEKVIGETPAVDSKQLVNRTVEVNLMNLINDYSKFYVKIHLQVEKVERALFREIDRIRDKPPTKKEMKRAASQTEAQFAYATDGITGMAYLLGSAELRVGYRYLEDLTERLMAVEREDVQRVAETYLSERNRTVGIFRPTEGGQ